MSRLDYLLTSFRGRFRRFSRKRNPESSDFNCGCKRAKALDSGLRGNDAKSKTRVDSWHRSGPAAHFAYVIVLASLLTGCERGMHEMYDQPKYKPLTPSPLFADGNASRPQVSGTVPRSAGALAGTSSGRLGRVTDVRAAEPVTGVDAQGKPLAQGGPGAQAGYSNPLPITPQLLRRGQQRFDIYCAPCHSRTGDGDGMIARRGFPHPPSYHTDALRNAPDSHFYDVITNGYGVMFPYADRVAPQDRWAIVAYIRALQLSQHAPASDLSRKDLERLDGASPRASNPSPSGRAAGVRVRYAAESPDDAKPSPAPSCVPPKGLRETCPRVAHKPGHPLPEAEGKEQRAAQ